MMASAGTGDMEKPSFEEAPLRVFVSHISPPLQCFLRGVGEMGVDLVELIEAASIDIKDSRCCSIPWANETLDRRRQMRAKNKISECITADESPIERDTKRLLAQPQDDMEPCQNKQFQMQVTGDSGQSAFGRNLVVVRGLLDGVGMHMLSMSFLRTTIGPTPLYIEMPLLKVADCFGWQDSPSGLWAADSFGWQDSPSGLWAFPGVGHTASVVVLVIGVGLSVGILLALCPCVGDQPAPEAPKPAFGRNVVSFPRVMAPRRRVPSDPCRCH